MSRNNRYLHDVSNWELMKVLFHQIEKLIDIEESKKRIEAKVIMNIYMEDGKIIYYLSPDNSI